MTEWVSVDDRLPEYDGIVLAYWRPIDHLKRPNHREIVLLSRSSQNGMWWSGTEGLYYDQETHVTHWMALPEPPDEE